MIATVSSSGITGLSSSPASMQRADLVGLVAQPALGGQLDPLRLAGARDQRERRRGA